MVEKLYSIQSLVRHSKSLAGARRLLQEATNRMQLSLGQPKKQDRAWNHEVHTLLRLAQDNIDEEKSKRCDSHCLDVYRKVGRVDSVSS